MTDSTDITHIARALGKRGGDTTKKRGSAYYRRIGRKGLAKRYGKPVPARPRGPRARRVS